MTYKKEEIALGKVWCGIEGKQFVDSYEGGYLWEAREMLKRLKKKHGFVLTRGWQPIETAPKDGTNIDILINGMSRIPEVYWGEFDGYKAPISAWLDGFDNPVVGLLANEITHWMPIPEAPEEYVK